MKQRDNIVLDDYIGSWYVIGEYDTKVGKLYLLEHEQYGDETACVCIDENKKVVLDGIVNGYDDIKDFLENVIVMDDGTPYLSCNLCNNMYLESKRLTNSDGEDNYRVIFKCSLTDREVKPENTCEKGIML